MSFKRIALLLVIFLQIGVVGFAIAGIFKLGFETKDVLALEGALVAVVAGLALLCGLLYLLAKFASLCGGLVSFVGVLLYILETLAFAFLAVYAAIAFDNIALVIALASTFAVMSVGLMPIVCKRR